LYIDTCKVVDLDMYFKTDEIIIRENKERFSW